MANINGTNVAAPIVPFTTDDTYATHEAKYGKGGMRTVSTLTARDAIPSNLRENGMLVYVEEDSKYYKLNVSTWEEFSSGGSSSAGIQAEWIELTPVLLDQGTINTIST